METFDSIIQDKRLLYSYIRGSRLYNINLPDSDEDHGGLFIAPKNIMYGLTDLYEPQVSDERHDNTFYEIGRFCELLLKSNANVLEALFVPKDKIIMKPKRCLKPLFENKNAFLTKDCFGPFVNYAVNQIRKARGLNKKIVNPIEERKWPLDFCYTFKGQGSTPIKYWLEYRYLDQEYCGLVNIPNMYGIYGVYYDWGRYFFDKKITPNDIFGWWQSQALYKDASYYVDKIKTATTDKERKVYNDGLLMCYKVNLAKFIVNFYRLEDDLDYLFGETFDEDEYNSEFLENIKEWYSKNNRPIGYRGVALEKSNEVRLSSVSKGEKPICYMSYNENGYAKHCIDYKNYQEWVKLRNPKRYESNLNKNYDSKNMCHSVRLMTMGYEIAKGDGLILDRGIAGDRDFLMKIRNHEFEYDELMKIVEDKQMKMEKAIKDSKLPDHIDKALVNDILIEIRKRFYSKIYKLF